MTIAIDTETFLITEDCLTPTLVCVSYCEEGSDEPGLLTAGPGLFDFVHDKLTREVCVFANAPFDLAVFRAAWPQLDSVIMQALEDGRIKDVLTREKLIDIASGKFFENTGKYSLAHVAKRRLRLVLDKKSGVRTSYQDLHGMPLAEWPVEAVDYAKLDATATMRIYESQQRTRRVRARDPLADEAHQARGHWALYQQTLVGIRTDVDKVKALDEQLSKEIAEHEAKAIEHGFARLVGKSKPKLTLDTKAVKAALDEHCAAHGLAPVVTETGEIATSKAAFEEAGLPLDHPLQHCRLMKSKKSLRSKGIEPMLKGLVRTNYSEVQETGRTSSYGSKLYPSTNLQNMPRAEGFRECLIARPGKIFVATDFVAAELVALSQVLVNLFGKSKLADALREGRDPHVEMGAMLGDIPVSRFDKSNTEHKELRQLAKAANFGLPGGLGSNTFIAFAKHTYGVEISPERAAFVKQAWFEQWPEMRDYFKWVNQQSKDGGETYEMLHVWSKRVRGGCRYTQACNTMFQGLAADAAKVSLWNLLGASKDYKSPLFRCPQVLFVHDEIVTEVPIESAEACRIEQEKIMIKSFAVPCPDVPVRVESDVTSYYRKT